MALQNYFPVTYQQQASGLPNYLQQPVRQVNNSIIWVLGDPGAKSFFVGAGESVILMDSENPFFYIKSADQTGIPTLRKFRYEEVGLNDIQNQKPEIDYSQFVTKDEFEKRIAKLNAQKRNTQNRKDGKSNAQSAV